jgi:N-acetylmuramoyl-L-alanine amidase
MENQQKPDEQKPDQQKPGFEPSKYLIFIDPGHGGIDPGAVDPITGTKEKDLNLEQAFILKEFLVRLGYRVGMSRTRDETVPLLERTEMAQRMGAALFFALHHDIYTVDRGGVYYSPHPGSEELARDVANALGPDSWLLPSSASRFGRLYIDDFPGTSVLAEFGPTRPTSHEDMIYQGENVARAINEFVRNYFGQAV